MVDEHRVVVTGLGAVTPIGSDIPATWAALTKGVSGVAPISCFDPDAHGLQVRVAAEVRGFDPGKLVGRREARRMDRVMQFAVVAAGEALASAGLLNSEDGRIHPDLVDPERAGVFVGSGLGGVETLANEQAVLLERGARRVSPLLLPMFLADSVPGVVAIRYGLRGPNVAHVSACASGANAIGEAAEAIRRGTADVMVAGGSEAGVVPIVLAGFCNMGALSRWAGDPVLASRPFDDERDGFVVGEGAGVMVLERLEHAMARGARPRAELVGYGCTADAGHITAPAPDGGGMLAAIRLALAQARLSAPSVAYVNAHGTGTRLNDVTETLVLRRLFGAAAGQVPVSSVKSMIGHLLGAGGAVESVATVLSVATGIIPPTINLHTPDPECDLDYVPNVARAPDEGVPIALSNSMGFGGHNVALVFARV